MDDIYNPLKNISMAIKVTVRKKKISKNRLSLYLDFYPAIPHPETGKPTRREFLGKYIPVKSNNGNKLYTKEQLDLSEQIRQKKELELNKPEIYSESEKQQLKIKKLGEKNFVAYFLELANKRKSSNHDNWMSTYNYLNAFTKGFIKFADLEENVKFCNNYKYYLLNAPSNRSSKIPLHQNSAKSYQNKFIAAIKQAFREGYLQKSLHDRIETIKYIETKKNVL
jgi:DNA-binding transcriptional MerR regulator